MANNIIFIGFMGVGKSTIARAYAKEKKTLCLDTDKLIENLENRSAKKIFKQDGEAYFRRLEQLTADWLEQNVQGSIISAGGGFIGVNNIKQIGTVIYLKSSFEGILKRLSEHPKAKAKFAKRPLFKDKKKARALFESRQKIYEKAADIVIEVENYKGESDIIEKLSKLLQTSF